MYNLYETTIYQHKNSELRILLIPSFSIYGNATNVTQLINAKISTTYHNFACLIWECQYQICTSANITPTVHILVALQDETRDSKSQNHKSLLLLIFLTVL
jgi:hypothetical protein